MTEMYVCYQCGHRDSIDKFKSFCPNCRLDMSTVDPAIHEIYKRLAKKGADHENTD